MSLSAAVIRELVSAGLDGDDLVSACERIENADRQVETPKRSAAAIRQERYRQRAVSAEEWSALRMAVFERDQYVCVYCGADVSMSPQCDHVIPLILGGGNAMSNLATSCKECNSSKSGRHPDEWRPTWQ